MQNISPAAPLTKQNKSDTIGMFRLRTSGSIASGDLKLGLGRYGIVAAFGHREVGNFLFTPTMVGNYQESITVENLLDSVNNHNVVVKAAVRKSPIFTVEPRSIDLGSETSHSEAPSTRSFVVTNVSKVERTFVVAVSLSNKGVSPISLSIDTSQTGSALSKGEEEEVEVLLQKLKIARRKGKSDKTAKYTARLTELGVPYPADDKVGPSDDASSGADRPETPAEGDQTPDNPSEPSGGVTVPAKSDCPTTTLTIKLVASQKRKISVHLLPHLGPSISEGTIAVYDRKNTDEVLNIAVTGQPSTQTSESSDKLASTSDTLDLNIMRYCLDLTSRCPVSPTAFCVGSILFLPSTASIYPALIDRFPAFPTSNSSVSSSTSPNTDSPSAGLILGEGYSRQIPGNTHAEANALTNFRSAYSSLSASSAPLPSIETVLSESTCYATLEPCSIRTSGGPSCALELVRAKVKRVYLGVEEPPDFVQCEGVKILQDGGVEVWRVKGLETECLQAARRGRDDA